MEFNEEVEITGENSNGIYMVNTDTDETAYIYADDLMEEEYIPTPEEEYEASDVSRGWDGTRLNSTIGTIEGPSGKETYYNLPMQGVIDIMRSIGNTDEYWVRDDGVKMLGNYIMVAADLNIHPRGSLVEVSLGTGIVCDTGTFIYENPYQIDIAVTW